MIGSPNQDQRSAVLAQLNASIDSFFLDGGQVQTLPYKGYVPRRAQRDLEPARAQAAPLNTRTERRQMRIE